MSSKDNWKYTEPEPEPILPWNSKTTNDEREVEWHQNSRPLSPTRGSSKKIVSPTRTISTSDDDNWDPSYEHIKKSAKIPRPPPPKNIENDIEEELSSGERTPVSNSLVTLIKRYRSVSVQTEVTYAPLRETSLFPLTSTTVQETISKQPRSAMPSLLDIEPDENGKFSVPSAISLEKNYVKETNNTNNDWSKLKNEPENKIGEWENPEKISSFSSKDNGDAWSGITYDRGNKDDRRNREVPEVSKDSWEVTTFSQEIDEDKFDDDPKEIPVSNGNRQEVPKIAKDSWDNNADTTTKTPDLFSSSDDWTKKAALFASQITDSVGSTNQWVEKQQYTEENYYNDFPSENKFGNGACHKCGKEGHIARNCIESGRGGRSEGKGCYNCGQEGHIARDCTESGRSGGRNDGLCYRCNESGHIAKECPNPNSTEDSGRRDCYKCHKPGHKAVECTEENEYGDFEGSGGSKKFACFNCGSLDHLATNCPSRQRHKPSPWDNRNPANLTSDEAWNKLLQADKERDVDDFKDAFEEYAKSSELTFQEIEKQLRASNCTGRLVALEREEIPLTKCLVDLQGITEDKKYVVQIVMGPPSRLARTAGRRAGSDDENIEWLSQAGFLRDDVVPVCFNCKKKGHITKECQEPKREFEKTQTMSCQKCGSSDHMTKYCKEERTNYNSRSDGEGGGGGGRGRGCFTCGSTEHQARECDSEDRGDDQKGYRPRTCHNCGEEGHFSRECTEPRRGGGGGGGGRRCHKCGEEGHFAKDCGGGGGDYGDYDTKKYENDNWRKDDGNLGDDQKRYRPRTCHNCGEEGHFSRECTEPRRGGGGGGGGGRRCHKCGEEGHFAKDCGGGGGGGGDYGTKKYENDDNWPKNDENLGPECTWMNGQKLPWETNNETNNETNVRSFGNSKQDNDRDSLSRGGKQDRDSSWGGKHDKDPSFGDKEGRSWVGKQFEDSSYGDKQDLSRGGRQDFSREGYRNNDDTQPTWARNKEAPKSNWGTDQSNDEEFGSSGRPSKYKGKESETPFIDEQKRSNDFRTTEKSTPTSRLNIRDSPRNEKHEMSGDWNTRNSNKLSPNESRTPTFSKKSSDEREAEMQDRPWWENNSKIS